MAQRLKIGIVAAMMREIKPLVRGWKNLEIYDFGRHFHAFSTQNAALICARIGDASLATKVLIERFDPEMIISIGFAGSLEATILVPAIFIPAQIVEEKTGVSFSTGFGGGRLVTSDRIVDKNEKHGLALKFGAQAVDMEASQVAEAAEARRRRFLAIKVISDNLDSDVAFLGDFVENGGFNTMSFVAHIAFRPHLWRAVSELRRNSIRAREVLCSFVEHIIKNPKELELRLNSTAGSGVVTPTS